MKKQKPFSSKSPPIPDRRHRLIEDWINEVKPDLRAIVQIIDQLILPEIVDPRFSIKWGNAFYGSLEFGWCIELIEFDASINIVFLNGEKLEQPPARGSGTRYVKIKSIEDARAAPIKTWIAESCSLRGWRW